MPHITQAMEWSRRRSVGDIIARSLIGSRTITGELSSVKNTFSSWDNCMAASYCKWPVIILIIFASLTVLGIVWCIVRCACCGMSCCCSCFSFLKCCDCCGGCCDGKKDKPSKHLDPYYPPAQGYQAPFQQPGYQAPLPMVTGAIPAAKSDMPQYAQFEVGNNGLAVGAKPISEDALPPMPSWETANKKHVLSEDEKNDVELGELNPTTGQKIPLMTGGAPTPGPPSPSVGSDNGINPYGSRPGQGNGYMGVTAADPYAQNRNNFNQNGRGLAGSPAPMPGPGRLGPSPGPGMAGQTGYRGSPGPGGYRGGPSPGPGRGYGGGPQNNGVYAPQNNGGYGAPTQNYGGNGFESAPIAGGYNNSQQDLHNTRPYPPQQPQRQYSSESAAPLNRQYTNGSSQDGYQNAPPARGPTPQQQHKFNFGPPGAQSPQIYPPQQQSYGPPQDIRNTPPPLQQQHSGYSQQGGTYNSPPPQELPGGYNAPQSRTPPQELQGQGGYRPYNAVNQAPRALIPGGGRGGEPERWDPVRR